MSSKLFIKIILLIIGVSIITYMLIFKQQLEPKIKFDENNEYQLGLGNEFFTQGDCKSAISWYEQSASQSNRKALTVLGKCYLYGNCVKLNPVTSFEYFFEAASKGDADAQNNLGVSYAIGFGVIKSYDKSIALFKESAEQGWSEAQFNLGISYKYGLGAKNDLEASEYWFKKSWKREIHQIESSNVKNKSLAFLDSNYLLKKEDWIRNWVQLGY